MSFIVVDTETSGLNPEKNAVLQIAAAKVTDAFEIVDTFNEYVYPPENLILEPGALKATGIDMIAVMSADDEKAVAKRFAEWLEPGQYVGYNAPFDLGFLFALQERVAVSFRYNAEPWHCVLKQARKLLKHLPSRKLVDVAAYFGIPHEQAHDALADVITTVGVWKKLEEL